MATSTVNIVETADRTQNSNLIYFLENLKIYLFKEKRVIWTNTEQVTAARSHTTTYQSHSSMRPTKNNSRAYPAITSSIL